MTLDLNTIIVMGGIIAAAMVVLFGVLCYEAKRDRLIWWNGLGLCAFLALISAIWRHDPDPVVARFAVLLSNIAEIAVYSCLLAALGLLALRVVSPIVLLAGPIVIGTFHVFPAFAEDANLRRATVAALACGYLVMSARLFVGERPLDRLGKRPFHQQLILGVLCFHAAANGIRIVMHLRGWIAHSDALGDAWHKIYLIESLCAGIVLLAAVLGFEAQGVRRTLEQKASEDSLTGTLNRGAFVDHLTHCVEREEIDGALLMFDLDHFKRINDTFGHAVGDRVLFEFARIALKTIGETGVLGRIGGEEFSCFIPDSSKVQALGIAEEIRWNLMRENLLGSHTVTVSIGLARASDADFQVKRLFDLADHALYRSKNLGRNRISVHQRPSALGEEPTYAADI